MNNTSIVIATIVSAFMSFLTLIFMGVIAYLMKEMKDDLKGKRSKDECDIYHNGAKQLLKDQKEQNEKEHKKMERDINNIRRIKEGNEPLVEGI